ncbi:MAG: VanW family protein [Eubacteriales bacterium]|nr:VanW family protein [Eubacteriales bacterium]
MEYYQAPRRGSGSGTSKRENARRAKIRKRRFILSLMGLALIGLIVVAVVVLARGCAEPPQVDLETGKFRSGVYINGMNLSGKTIDEVKGQLESNESYALNNIAITLSSAELTATITGADMNATSNLSEVMEQALSGGSNQVYYTKISIDDAALSARIDEINATTSAPPVDASFSVDFSSSGKPAFNYVEGSAGYGLDSEATIALVKQTIESGQLQATITPTLTTIQPSVTVDDVKAHTTLIGKFTTTYDFKGTAEDTEEQRTIFIPNRAFNVEKGASMISDQVIKPGEKWSFNDTVGDRSVESNGWKLAQGIFGGDRKTPQLGGGICQVSTTLYNALLEAYPYFDFVDRSAHSIPSTYVDKGLDATVDSNHIDFQVKNISEYPVYIFAYTGENKMAKSRKRDLTVVIYGEALPAGTEYKTRTVLISEEAPLEEDAVITETGKLFVGEENVLAEAHTKFVVDVYIDRYLNGELQESIFLHEDTYPGNPLKKEVGTKPTPTPLVDPTPTPNPDDMP